MIAVKLIYFRNLFKLYTAIYNKLKGGTFIDYKNDSREEFNTKRANHFWKIVDILDCKIKPIAKLYEKTIGKKYMEESKHFNLSNAKRVLHIGCGSYPITAMKLAEMGYDNIVTIDQDAKALKRANKVLYKRNLNGRIKAEKGSGTTYPLGEFDTIIVSGCSVPKKQVLEHILKNSEPKTRIIVRKTELDVDSFIKNLNPPQDVSIIDKKENYIVPTIYWDSILIIKNN
ncbi:MAG: class I SAM-dependent methyltransferase [Thermoplasmatales archaeon]|nr:class I SAM-dependent methyltransferase [Thermoplasmatales archaeon]